MLVGLLSCELCNFKAKICYLIPCQEKSSLMQREAQYILAEHRGLEI